MDSSFAGLRSRSAQVREESLVPRSGGSALSLAYAICQSGSFSEPCVTLFIILRFVLVLFERKGYREKGWQKSLSADSLLQMTHMVMAGPIRSQEPASPAQEFKPFPLIFQARCRDPGWTWSHWDTRLCLCGMLEPQAGGLVYSMPWCWPHDPWGLKRVNNLAVGKISQVLMNVHY